MAVCGVFFCENSGVYPDGSQKSVANCQPSSGINGNMSATHCSRNKWVAHRGFLRNQCPQQNLCELPICWLFCADLVAFYYSDSISQLSRYFACSDVSLSMLRPQASSFLNATSLSISDGTGMTPGSSSLCFLTTNSALSA